MKRKSLHWADWLVFVISLAISAAIGIFFACTGGKQRTTKEYLVADRKLSVVPAALSMFMSFLSAISVLGQPAEIYFHGGQIWLEQIGSGIGHVAASLIFVPLFYRLKLISSYEYLAKRFGTDKPGKVLRLTCVILAIIYMVTNMGLAMFAPATALEAVTGFPPWASVTIMGVVATFYSTIGGMKAVVWTDAFQGSVLIGGLIAILISGVMKVGGLSRVWEISRDNGRLNVFNFNPDPTLRMNFWILTVGRILVATLSTGTGQHNIQRFCSMPTLTSARLSVVGFFVFYSISIHIFILCGLTMFAYFTLEGCDPLRGGLIRSQNQVFPYFVVNVLGHPGLSGLFLAVLFSGAMSTLSSLMNGLSAITWRDLVQNRLKNVSESRQAFITKIIGFEVKYKNINDHKDIIYDL